MAFEDEGYGSLELLVPSRQEQKSEEQLRQAQLDQGRRKVDEARLKMADMAKVATELIGMRLLGLKEDPNGVAITDERIDAAFSVLDRVGIPKLRAHAIAASIAHAPTSPAAGSPGWEPPPVGDGDDMDELDVGSVDAKIDAFLQGAAAARKTQEGDAA